jgi:opacity protein-like surface antigen
MRKLIFLVCFFGLVHSVPAQGLKGKLIFTAKTSYSRLLPGQGTEKTYRGFEIGYFLTHQLQLGLNLDYLEYDEQPNLVKSENSGSGHLPSKTKQWYSLGLYSKLLFDIRRFSPFVRAGFGIFIPRITYYPYFSPASGIRYSGSDPYRTTYFGMNLGAGIQYRVWKGLCLQSEGLITAFTYRDEEIDLDRDFTYVNLNAGLSIIF